MARNIEYGSELPDSSVTLVLERRMQVDDCVSNNFDDIGTMDTM